MNESITATQQRHSARSSLSLCRFLSFSTRRQIGQEQTISNTIIIYNEDDGASLSRRDGGCGKHPQTRHFGVFP
jgi:hypothetical protein